MKWKLRNLPLQRWGLDPRKSLLALVVVVIALLLWSRLLLKNAPRTAVAEPGADAQVDAGNSQAAGVKMAVIRTHLPEDLKRDLFAVAADRFALAELPLKMGKDAGSEEKSPAQATDRELWAKSVQLAARVLKLETTLQGPVPRALINGQMYAPGQKVQGFTVKVIESRRVVLGMDDVEVHLDME